MKVGLYPVEHPEYWRKEPMRERATDIEYLEWFYQNADFGPAECDVRMGLKERFMDETGKNLPQGYNYGEDGETIIDQ